MAETMRESISVRRIGANEFEARPFYEQAQMGNSQPIAFGGLVLSQAVTAGHQTLPQSPEYHMYSCNGTYLGPCSTEVPTLFHVQDIRTTRSFCTRLITASQTPPPRPGAGSDKPAAPRRVLVVLLDFQTAEPESMMTYSTPPLYPFPATYGNPNTLPSEIARANELLPPKVVHMFKESFAMSFRYFDRAPCPHGYANRNFLAMRDLAPCPSGAVDEAQLDLTERTNAYWVKVKEPLQGKIEQAAAMAFLTDMALAFLPLSLTDRMITSVSAVSSLDFSLRFFRPFDLNQWHLNEQHTEHGAGGRTFSVGKIYNADGIEIAHMSQMSILRDKPSKSQKPEAKL